MRATNLFLLIFILSAFAIGASLHEADVDVINIAFENVTTTINNITLGETNDTYADGILRITENYMRFIGVTMLETMRLGTLFGQENPEYFEPEFIVKIIKLLVWLAIISLLIQPCFYAIVFIVMAFIFIKDHINKRRTKKHHS